MKAYVIVDITITEREGFTTYVGQITDLIVRHGGRYLVRGPNPEVILAGSVPVPELLVVVEFPSMENARAFIDARQELGLADLFAGSTDSRILLAEGVG
ncbi:MAG TPA: DUF1330 domain-containing protein [Myxococcota bacterium]|nr:DUF1330 domain-containing protein [Myxococcota bacterium]